MLRISCFAIALLVLVTASAPAQAQTIYTFQIIDEVTGTSNRFEDFKINDNGQVAYLRITATEETLYFFDGMTSQVIATVPAGGFRTQFELNILGQVAAVVRDTSGTTVELFDGTSTTTIITEAPGRRITSIQLNKNGQVAALVGGATNPFLDTIEFFDGSSLSTVITEPMGGSIRFFALNDAGQIAAITSDGREAIVFFNGTTTIDTGIAANFLARFQFNQAGQVVAEARRRGGARSVEFFDGRTSFSIFPPPAGGTILDLDLNDLGQVAISTRRAGVDNVDLYGGGTLTTIITEPAGGFLNGDVALNNSGQAAILGRDGSGPTVEFFDGTSQSNVLTNPSGTSLISESSSAVLNESGQVIMATTNASEDVFFELFDGTSQFTLIAEDDPLGGSPIRELFPGDIDPEGFNTPGQLVFEARLTDGRRVLVLATPQQATTPTPVPAMGWIGMLATLAGLLCIVLRRRK